jgi:hypothetical protein
VIVLHESSLRRVLNSYFDYYNIIEREHISRLGRTRPSHDPFSRRKWGQSWRCRRSVDCTTATNDGPPKEPESTVLRVASAWPFEICLRTVPTCTYAPPRISFTRLEQVRVLLELSGSPRGIASALGCTEFSIGTIDTNELYRGTAWRVMYSSMDRSGPM